MAKKRGPQTIHKLGSAKVKNGAKGQYCDGGNLWLVKDSRTTGRWSYRFQFNKKNHELGLRSIHTVSMTKARAKARELRELQQEGINPLEDRRATALQEKLKAANAVTFRDFAEEYVRNHRAGWTAKHAQQWKQSLVDYVFPIIGDLPVAAIDTAQIERVLRQPIDGVLFWDARAPTAVRVRARIEMIFGAATVAGRREGDNPARWKGHLQHLFTSRSAAEKGEDRHFPALPYNQVPSFMAALRAREGMDARLLEFHVLTSARPQESRALPWSEINLTDRVWLCPAARMKSRKDHKVPLSARAMQILEIVKEMGNESPYVFSGRGGGMLGDKAMSKLMADMGQADYTPHGFRSSFRDWVAECTEHPREAAEIALSHAVGDATEQAYMRTKLFNRRRALADDWAEFCCAGATGVVLPFAHVG